MSDFVEKDRIMSFENMLRENINFSHGWREIFLNWVTKTVDKSMR